MIKVKAYSQSGGKNKVRSAIEVAGRRAIKRTMTTIETHARRRVAAETGIKPTILKKYIRIIKQPSQRSAQSIMRMFKRGLPLIQFGAKAVRVKTRRGKRTGVSIDVGQGREIVPQAFIAETKSGHRGVFKRKGQKRLPIVEQFSSALTKVLESSDFLREVEKIAVETFRKNFKRELEFELKKRGS